MKPSTSDVRDDPLMINSQLQWLLDLRDNQNYYSKAGQIVIEVQTYFFFNSLYIYIYIYVCVCVCVCVCVKSYFTCNTPLNMYNIILL